MKTLDRLILEAYGYEPPPEEIVARIKEVAKANARQWVERAAEVAEVTDGETYLENYYVDQQSIIRLIKEIDAQ